MEDVAASGFSALFGVFYSLFCCGIYVIPAILGILLMVLWIWMLVDVAQREDSTFSDENGKLLWVLIVVLGGWVGAAVYYFVEYRKYKQAK